MSIDKIPKNPISAPDYEQIAAGYDQRYQQGETPAIRQIISSYKQLIGIGSRWLEVGCGTGQWLRENPPNIRVLGLDASYEMLHRAASKVPGADLVRGLAHALPFSNGCTGGIAVIHAFHHFSNPDRFLRETARLLQAGGGVLILGMNAHSPGIKWYIYDFFEGTRQRDQARFPDFSYLAERMKGLGFSRIDRGLAQQVNESYHGKEVLQQPFLSRRGCSQMALLTDDAYELGIRAIKTAIQQNPNHVFPAEIPLEYLWAVKDDGKQSSSFKKMSSNP